MRLRSFLAAAVLLAFPIMAFAFPEFQKFSQEHSGRRVDCAMCHIAPTGPSGTGFGQITGLNNPEKELLQQSRNAKQPGQDVHSPILNAFGNELVRVLGGDAITAITTEPQKLATLYGFKSDLDQDGIPDAQEFLDGTDPTSNQSGRPWALFAHNLRRNALSLMGAFIGTILVLAGIKSLLTAYKLRSGY